MQLTPQQFYDKTIAHLVKQGHKASSAGIWCAYRAGLDSCAIGCHIPDEKYESAMEGRVVDVLVIQWPSVKEYVLPSGDQRLALLLASNLQRLHDADESWNRQSIITDYFKDTAFGIAQRFKLVPYHFAPVPA